MSTDLCFFCRKSNFMILSLIQRISLNQPFSSDLRWSDISSHEFLCEHEHLLYVVSYVTDYC